MEQLFDEWLIVDVETSCWENRIPPVGEKSEIFQTGLCLFNIGSALPHGKRSIVNRLERSRVSEFCTRLTGFTQVEVDAGISFRRACSVLETEYQSQKRTWVSWGNFDKRMFWEQCHDHHIAYPFGNMIRGRHVNLKNLFAGLMGLPDEEDFKISDALRMLGLEFGGQLHRGDDDAWNIGRILSEISVAVREFKNARGWSDYFAARGFKQRPPIQKPIEE